MILLPDRLRPTLLSRSRLARIAQISLLATTLTACLAFGATLTVSAQSTTTDASMKPGVVTLRDGRTLEGEIAERERDVTIDVNGIVTTMARSAIASIEYGTPEQRLQRRLDVIPPGNFEARLLIADEALRRGLLDFAETTAMQVRRADPNNARAVALLDQIERQRQIRRSEGQGVRGRSAPSGAAENPGRALRPAADNVLNEEQINRLRQAELQPADAEAQRDRVRVNFRDGVLRRFVQSRPNLEFREFNRLDDVRKALTILQESDDEEMRDDVRITTHPLSILQYLSTVQPVVLNGCATSACHGGDAAGKFALYGEARDEAASYTNFYLLSTGGAPVPQKSGGAFGGGGEEGDGGATAMGRLIDRDQPDESLLLHYMLPPGRTRYPHPEVEGYTALVEGPEAENYQIIRRWIDESLTRLSGQGYGFEFRMELSSTRPAGDTAPPQTGDAPSGTPPGAGSASPPAGQTGARPDGASNRPAGGR